MRIWFPRMLIRGHSSLVWRKLTDQLSLSTQVQSSGYGQKRFERLATKASLGAGLLPSTLCSDGCFDADASVINGKCHQSLGVKRSKAAASFALVEHSSIGSRSSARGLGTNLPTCAVSQSAFVRGQCNTPLARTRGGLTWYCPKKNRSDCFCRRSSTWRCSPSSLPTSCLYHMRTCMPAMASQRTSPRPSASQFEETRPTLWLEYIFR